MKVLLDFTEEVLKLADQQARQLGRSRKKHLEAIVLKSFQDSFGKLSSEVRDITKKFLDANEDKIKSIYVPRRETKQVTAEPREGTGAFFLKYGVMTKAEIKTKKK